MRRGTRLLAALVVVVMAGSAFPADPQAPQRPFRQLFPFRDGGKGAKWGFVDSQGHTVIAPKYEHAGYFQEGRALVRRKSGADAYTQVFIDDHDRVIFELPNYLDQAKAFSEGLVWVRSGRLSKWGCYDRNGKVVIAPKYDDVGDFSEGLARVNIGAVKAFPYGWEGGKWGYVDKTGREVIPILFDLAEDFSRGSAEVRIGTKSAFIDVTGREIPASKVAPKPRAKEDLPPEVVRVGDTRTEVLNDRRKYRGDLALVHLGGSRVTTMDGPTYWIGGAWYYVSRNGELVVRMCQDSDDFGP